MIGPNGLSRGRAIQSEAEGPPGSMTHTAVRIVLALSRERAKLGVVVLKELGTGLSCSRFLAG